MKPSDSDVAAFLTFLKDQGLVFACAESCTGGLLAQEMTSLAGSSQVFWGGVVTYANEAKERLLGVAADLIDREGAVSAEVAQAMVLGLLRVSGVPLAVAITGVAGPEGGTEAKPVGTVWFGLAAQRQRTGIAALRLQFNGDRGAIREQATAWARKLALVWWQSGMHLDSMRALTDNEGKSVVRACPPPLYLPPL